MASLADILRSVTSIARSEDSPKHKVILARPFLLKCEKISKQFAKATRSGYEGGCGGDGVEEEQITFTITPAPKHAIYIYDSEFDDCKLALPDPYDERKCDGAWKPIPAVGRFFSDTYRYRVTWGDGSITNGKFGARGKKPKTIRIIPNQ
jgi:hypothetical protein